jgi:hypothetical protein
MDSNQRSHQVIEIKFTIDPERNAYDQLQRFIRSFAPQHTVGEVVVTATPAASTVTISTEPSAPVKRGRKAKETPVVTKAEVTETVIPDFDDRDAEDEAFEAAGNPLTHDDVRTAVGLFTKEYGIAAKRPDRTAKGNLENSRSYVVKTFGRRFESANGKRHGNQSF